MTNLSSVTEMCKQGDVQGAFRVAKEDLLAAPTDVWNQRKMAWVLYYLLKDDVAEHKREVLHDHVELLCSLDALTPQEDAVLMDCCLWKLAAYVKSLSPGMEGEATWLFARMNRYHFLPSKAYSCFLHAHLHLTAWGGLTEFVEWWNLDNLLPEDFTPYAVPGGRTLMSLAEQAHLAYAKALLRRGDRERMSKFLPVLEQLAAKHSEMAYPGYYCGKLLMAMGETKDRVLDVLVPFVRERKREFWAWQLLAEVYAEEPTMRLACLLRAVHCKTQETFLGRVRLELASLYVAAGDVSRAKFHLDRVAACYSQQGWHLPADALDMLRYVSARTQEADGSDGTDYRAMTDALLLRDCPESLAVVTWVDTAAHRAALVYGHEKRTAIALKAIDGRVEVGTLLRVREYHQGGKHSGVCSAVVVPDGDWADLPYLKRLHGVVKALAGRPYGFVKSHGVTCFIKPELVAHHHVTGGEHVTVLAVLDYNKKKEEWQWTAATLEVTQRGEAEKAVDAVCAEQKNV